MPESCTGRPVHATHRGVDGADPLHLVLSLKDLRAALRVGLRKRFGGTEPDEAMEIRDSGVELANVLAAVRAAREGG